MYCVRDTRSTLSFIVACYGAVFLDALYTNTAAKSAISIHCKFLKVENHSGASTSIQYYHT